ncbi:hypothetical protein RIF29_21399 [Crotalaria pallida]|uniref:Uncharacterized protein n=1 Tax=Crotalaria pallida TaxID=3830 RepID=A0AAN9F797_CROPI
MEFLNKIAEIGRRASNNNTVINVCLAASFGLLCMRSLSNQKTLQALEAEKESLVKSNKAIRKTLWDWKQELFAEASTDSAVVPLERLKAIYGEAPPPQRPTHGDTVKQASISSGPTRIIV